MMHMKRFKQKKSKRIFLICLAVLFAAYLLNGYVLNRVEFHSGTITYVSTSPNGELGVSGSENELTLYDAYKNIENSDVSKYKYSFFITNHSSLRVRRVRLWIDKKNTDLAMYFPLGRDISGLNPGQNSNYDRYLFSPADIKPEKRGAWVFYVQGFIPYITRVEYTPVESSPKNEAA